LTELTGIGAELRRAREAQGLAVADVAQQLKFAPRQIESLENERFDRLPGPTIARGMVRNYARLLGIDAEPLVERMSPKAEPASDPAQLASRFKQPVPFSDSARRSTLVYAAFSVAVLALAGVVAYEWWQERAAPQVLVPAQPQPAEPERMAALPPQAEAPKPAEKVQPPIEEKAKPVAEKPKPPAEKPKPVAAAKPEAPKPAAVPEVPPPPQVATGNLHRIEFTCQEESWIEVKDGTGRSLVSSLNPAGCQRLVRGRGPFEIVIGNARGVTLSVDGKPVDLAQHTRGGDVARVTFE
jgi:cytoskeleton protein RodZ